MALLISNGSLSRLNPVYGSCRNFLLQRFTSLSLEQRAGLKQKLEEKLSLPARPKKPMTPFFKYMIQMRPSVLEKNPTLSVTDVSKIIAQMWANAEDNVKNDLEKQYQKEVAQYTNAKMKYNSELTEDQKEAIKQAKLEIVETKTKKKLKKKAQDLGRPKRPLSSYMLFAMSKMSERGNLKVNEWQQKLSKEWENMNEDAKQPYVKESKEKLENYTKQLVKWEEKMINDGHVDLVRTESLVPKTRSKK